MGWLKNFAQESNAVILLHFPRFVEPLFDPKSLVQTFGFFGNFSIFLPTTKLCAGAFRPVLENISRYTFPTQMIL